MTDLQDAIARYWGYTTFRPLQREAMGAVLADRDSLVVLPTIAGFLFALYLSLTGGST